jgi:hypothetical protein
MAYMSYKSEDGGSKIFLNLIKAVLLSPDGTAIVRITLVEPDWTTQASEESYECSFGRGLRFKVVPKIDEAISAYSSYDETKAAILDGVQMKIIFRPNYYCDLVEGPPVNTDAFVGRQSFAIPKG